MFVAAYNYGAVLIEVTNKYCILVTTAAIK